MKEVMGSLGTLGTLGTRRMVQDILRSPIVPSTVSPCVCHNIHRHYHHYASFNMNAIARPFQLLSSQKCQPFIQRIPYSNYFSQLRLSNSWIRQGPGQRRSQPPRSRKVSRSETSQQQENQQYGNGFNYNNPTYNYYNVPPPSPAANFYTPPDPSKVTSGSVISNFSSAGELLSHSALVVVRQLEMFNVFLGFEQANKYAIMDTLGNHVG
jgi:hypothetical protein